MLPPIPRDEPKPTIKTLDQFSAVERTEVEHQSPVTHRTLPTIGRTPIRPTGAR